MRRPTVSWRPQAPGLLCSPEGKDQAWTPRSGPAWAYRPPTAVGWKNSSPRMKGEDLPEPHSQHVAGLGLEHGFSFPSLPQGWRCNHSPSGHGCLLGHKPLEAAFPAFCKSEPASSSSLVLRLPWDATDVGTWGLTLAWPALDTAQRESTSCHPPVSSAVRSWEGPATRWLLGPCESQDEDKGLPATGPTSPASNNTEHLCTRPGPHPQDVSSPSPAAPPRPRDGLGGHSSCRACLLVNACQASQRGSV